MEFLLRLSGETLIKGEVVSGDPSLRAAAEFRARGEVVKIPLDSSDGEFCAVKSFGGLPRRLLTGNGCWCDLDEGSAAGYNIILATGEMVDKRISY